MGVYHRNKVEPAPQPPVAKAPQPPMIQTVPKATVTTSKVTPKQPTKPAPQPPKAQPARPGTLNLKIMDKNEAIADNMDLKTFGLTMQGLCDEYKVEITRRRLAGSSEFM